MEDIDLIDEFFRQLIEGITTGEDNEAILQAAEMGDDQVFQLAKEAMEAGSTYAREFYELIMQLEDLGGLDIDSEEPISAKLGAKLQTVGSIKGRCPKGMVFKNGGMFGVGRCIKCDKMDSGNEKEYDDEENEEMDPLEMFMLHKKKMMGEMGEKFTGKPKITISISLDGETEEE